MDKSPLKMVDTVYQDYKITNGQQKTFYQKKKLKTQILTLHQRTISICCDLHSQLRV